MLKLASVENPFSSENIVVRLTTGRTETLTFKHEHLYTAYVFTALLNICPCLGGALISQNVYSLVTLEFLSFNQKFIIFCITSSVFCF